MIDVGINVDENGKLCGDVDYDTIQDKAQAATPVPGGVGAVTTAVLAKHLMRAATLVISRKSYDPRLENQDMPRLRLSASKDWLSG